MMQPGSTGGRNGTTSKWENDQEISAVSVLDDDGASGVGAAAAAAVSVALARSWAAAASQKQAAMVERTTSGSLKPGRAGFRLVAAVSNTDLARLGGSSKRNTFDLEVLSCCVNLEWFGRLYDTCRTCRLSPLLACCRCHLFPTCCAGLQSVSGLGQSCTYKSTCNRNTGNMQHVVPKFKECANASHHLWGALHAVCSLLPHCLPLYQCCSLKVLLLCRTQHPWAAPLPAPEEVPLLSSLRPSLLMSTCSSLVLPPLLPFQSCLSQKQMALRLWMHKASHNLSLSRKSMHKQSHRPQLLPQNSSRPKWRVRCTQKQLHCLHGSLVACPVQEHLEVSYPPLLSRRDNVSRCLWVLDHSSMPHESFTSIVGMLVQTWQDLVFAVKGMRHTSLINPSSIPP